MTFTTAPEEQAQSSESNGRSAPANQSITATVIAVFIASFSLILYLDWYYRFDLGDDAFIHLRIAHNLLRLGHPYFNPGEPVMVTSSPVWTLFLALSELLFGARSMIWIWNAIFVGVAAAAAYWIARASPECCKPIDRITALLVPLAVVAGLAASSFSGMESLLAVTFLFLAAVAFLRSSMWALPLLSLAAFTRYELAVALAIAGLACLATRTAVKHGAIPAGAISGAMTIWLWSQFGTVFPSAIHAKSKGYVVSAGNVVENIPARPPVLPVAVQNAFLLFLLAALAFWLVESIRNPTRRGPLRIVALGLALWGYSLGGLYIWGHTLIFEWYRTLVWVPVLVGILLMILVEPSKPRKIAAFLLLTGSSLSLFLVFLSSVHMAMSWRPEGLPVAAEEGRIHQYLAVGAALRQTCPQSQLMTSEIGALGYAFQGYVADGFGIASPAAIKYHPLRVPEERSNPLLAAIPAGFVRERKPDLIVTYDILGKSVLEASDIQAEYADLRFYPVLPREASFGVPPVWGEQTFHVLVRKNGSCPVSKADENLSRILLPESESAEKQR